MKITCKSFKVWKFKYNFTIALFSIVCLTFIYKVVHLIGRCANTKIGMYFNFLERRIKKGLVLERTIVWQDLGVIFAQNKSFICDEKKNKLFSIIMGSKSLWSYISTLIILWNILWFSKKWKSQDFFRSQSC